MFVEFTEVSRIEKVAASFFLLSMKTKLIHQGVNPGNFVLIRSVNDFPLLMRPFTISGVDEGAIEIIFKVVGGGIELLLRRKEGETIYLMSPLGKGFDTINLLEESRNIILAGVGSGVASLLFLSIKLHDHLRGRGENINRFAFLGFKRGAKRLCIEYMEGAGFRVFVSSEDGVEGMNGIITDVTKKKFSLFTKGTTLFSAVPVAMLRSIQAMVKDRIYKHFLFLQGIVACGVGVCKGCAISENGGGYLLLYKEGPIVESERIDSSRL